MSINNVVAAVLAAGLIFAPFLAHGQLRRPAGYASTDTEWRFVHHERRVKVVLLAGSIGAYQNNPYARLLHNWCSNAEIQNRSVVGLGAPQLYRRFREDVLENPQVPLGAPGVEFWLLFGGGLNSVGSPERTNHAMRRLFELAHRRRFRVAALTLTPWGTDDPAEHWVGARGLRALRGTRRVVDFTMGRLSPREALGRFRNQRSMGRDAPWDRSEVPDVAIDLYDSALRDRNATVWPEQDLRRILLRDPQWNRTVADLPPELREAQLRNDVRFLSRAPTHFMRREFRAFDHIHPNAQGHRLMAEAICPDLPASWQCSCP